MSFLFSRDNEEERGERTPLRATPKRGSSGNLRGERTPLRPSLNGGSGGTELGPPAQPASRFRRRISTGSTGRGPARKKQALNWRVLWICACCVALGASERLFFKLLVDRMGTRYLSLTQAVVLAYLVFMAAVVMLKYARGDIIPVMEGFPTGLVVVMAALDTLQLLMLTISASLVPASLTVLLLQASVPLSMMLSWGWRGTSYSLKHWIGSQLMLLAMVIALIPSLGVFFWGSEHHKCSVDPHLLTEADATKCKAEKDAVWMALVYLGSCVPVAVSSVFKEAVLTAYGRPVDPHDLNLRVLCFQLLFVLLVTPCCFLLRGYSWSSEQAFWHELWKSNRQGWKCWLGSSGSNDAPETECAFALPLVLAYVCSALLLTRCMTYLVEIAENIRYIDRTVILSVVTSVVILCGYSWVVGDLSSSLNLCAMVSAALVVQGLVVYHMDGQPQAEVITTPSSRPQSFSH